MDVPKRLNALMPTSIFPTVAAANSQGTTTDGGEDGRSSSTNGLTDRREIERSNLLVMSRIVMKSLLEFVMQERNRLLTAEQKELGDLFVMVERAFKHGFKGSRTLISLKTPEAALWSLIEKLGGLSNEASEAVQCVQQLPNVHSPLCRLRAWMRLAVMQKKLADYFLLLVEAKTLLEEYYEEWAFLREESGVVFAGSLLGLRVIDCNLYLKEDDLNRQRINIDLAHYIKIPTVPTENGHDEENGNDGSDNGPNSTRRAGKKDEPRRNADGETQEEELKRILDQKNYLEERNRQLLANLRNYELQQKRQQTHSPTTKSVNNNSSLIVVATTTSATSTKDMTDKKAVSSPYSLSPSNRDDLHDTADDPNDSSNILSSEELSVDQVSPSPSAGSGGSTGSNHNNSNSNPPTAELDQQKTAEMSLALELLEKDVHEKQDSLISLRSQMDDVKTINQELYHKLRVSEENLRTLERRCVHAETEQKSFETAAKTTVSDLQEKLTEALDTGKKADATADNLRMEAKSRAELCGELQKELADMHMMKREILDREQEQLKEIDRLKKELAELKNAEKEFVMLKNDYEELEATAKDYEKTLEELGVHLSKSKLQEAEHREGLDMLAEAQWESDKDVVNCKACQQKFNVSRRKHHCRHCGGIFCGTCSENTMPLPSSAKPVRVCDACYTLLLHRYSKTTTTPTVGIPSTSATPSSLIEAENPS